MRLTLYAEKKLGKSIKIKEPELLTTNFTVEKQAQ